MKFVLICTFLLATVGMTAQVDSEAREVDPFVIFVKQDSIFVDQKKVSKNSLRVDLRRYIIRNTSDSKINVKADPKTNVSEVMVLREFIQSTINELKNDYSRKIFGVMSYKELSDSNKYEIDKYFPSRF